MNLDKISEERLFQNNTKEEVMRWCQELKYFHYMRSRGGHNCEGDSFCVYIKYADREDLIRKLNQIGIELHPLQDGFIAFDPFESYSIEELDKLKITIADFNDLEQPQYVDVFGHKAHIWVITRRFEISISGTKDRQTYKVSEDDFKVCQLLEAEFDKLAWSSILDEDIKQQIHCVSREKYPELYE